MNVLEWPHPILETKSEDVREFGDKLQSTVSSMFETMQKANGIGLAANQVGILERIFIVHIPYSEGSDPSQNEERRPWHDKKFVFINPVIEKRTGKTKCMEGCLSFPDIYEYVDRSESILVKAFDEKGKSFQIEADGLFSVCIQHELDHIDGIVFLNRMSRLKAGLAKKKIQKRLMTTGRKLEEA